MVLPIALLFATGISLITQSEVARDIIETSEAFVGDEATELGELLIAGVEGVMSGVDEIMAGTEWRVVGLSASSNKAVSVASPMPVALVVGIGGSLFGDMRATAILLAFAACGVVESLPTTTTPKIIVDFPEEPSSPTAGTTTKGEVEVPPRPEVPGKSFLGVRGEGGCVSRHQDYSFSFSRFGPRHV